MFNLSLKQKSIKLKVLKKNTLQQDSITLKNTIILTTILGFIGCWLLLRILNTHGSTILPTSINTAKTYRRIISGIHALLVIILVIPYLTKSISLASWRKCLGLSIGYFIFDTTSHFFCDTPAFSSVFEYLLHHGITSLIILSYIKKYPRHLAIGLLSEISTPILHLSWGALQMHYTHTIYFKALACCLLLTFAIFRVYNFTKILWSLHRQKATIVELAGFSSIVLLNYYWFIRLLHKWLILYTS